jgi:hypothetical protein
MNPAGQDRLSRWCRECGHRSQAIERCPEPRQDVAGIATHRRHTGKKGVEHCLPAFRKEAHAVGIASNRFGQGFLDDLREAHVQVRAARLCRRSMVREDREEPIADPSGAVIAEVVIRAQKAHVRLRVNICCAAYPSSRRRARAVETSGTTNTIRSSANHTLKPCVTRSGT